MYISLFFVVEYNLQFVVLIFVHLSSSLAPLSLEPYLNERFDSVYIANKIHENISLRHLTGWYQIKIIIREFFLFFFFFNCIHMRFKPFKSVIHRTHIQQLYSEHLSPNIEHGLVNTCSELHTVQNTNTIIVSIIQVTLFVYYYTTLFYCLFRFRVLLLFSITRNTIYPVSRVTQPVLPLF